MTASGSNDVGTKDKDDPIALLEEVSGIELD
jgi:hypothetical protein